MQSYSKANFDIPHKKLSIVLVNLLLKIQEIKCSELKIKNYIAKKELGYRTESFHGCWLVPVDIQILLLFT